MTGKIEFELVSPEKLILSEPVEMVVVPGIEGDLGVLPGHSPLISVVRPGVIYVYEAGSIKNSIFVAGGFCEVEPERCTVLAVEAVPVDEIDGADALKRDTDAKQLVAGENINNIEVETERRIAQAMLAAVAD